MAAMVRTHDWANTPLGPIADWPDRLKAIIDLVLGSPLVASVAVGCDRILIYNDVAARLYGERHPEALGRPLAEVFGDGYPAVAAFYDRGFAGEAVRIAVQPFAPAEQDEVFDAYLTPVRDAVGTVIGVQMVGLEIGRRGCAEAALRENESRFRALVTAGGNSIYRMSPDWRSMYPLDSDTLGVTAAPIEDWVEQHIPPTDLPAVRKAIDTAIRTKSLFQLEHRVWGADGGIAWILSRAVPLLGPDGEIVEWFGARTVVTERREAEEALRDSEERLRLTIELVPVLLWSASPDGRDISLNERWMAYTGQSKAETQDYGWLDAIHPDDLPAAREAFDRAFATGEPIERQQRIHKAGDGYRWHLVRHVPVRDDDGVIVRWFGAAVDIHDGKLAERALDESERRLQTLMEGVPQLVWRASDPGVWTWASPQWTSYTGQAERDSHGWGWLDPVHPDDRDRVRAIWAEAIDRGAFEADYRICHLAEHRYRWFQTRATPVRDQSGRIIEWLGTSTDVDDLRRLQDRQEVLVAELQHRTRNLMSVVRSTADRTGETSRDIADFRSRFQDRLDALARVQGLLSRLTNTDRISFDELIRTEIAAMHGSGKRVTLDGPAGIKLRSSTVQTLAMALHELATNAVKYGALGQANGHLAITWRLVERDRRGRPRLRVEWHESGVAMPPAAAVTPSSGQGRDLIERALPYQLNAETSFELGPDGVRCTIVVPISATMPDNIDAVPDGRTGTPP